MLDFSRCFPPHLCLYIEHNNHKSYYETVEQAIGTYYQEEDFIDEDEKKRCIETNTCWTLQLYCITPIGFYKLIAHDPNKLLERMWEIYKEQPWEDVNESVR